MYSSPGAPRWMVAAITNNRSSTVVFKRYFEFASEFITHQVCFACAIIIIVINDETTTTTTTWKQNRTETNKRGKKRVAKKKKLYLYTTNGCGISGTRVGIRCIIYIHRCFYGGSGKWLTIDRPLLVEPRVVVVLGCTPRSFACFTIFYNTLCYIDRRMPSVLLLLLCIMYMLYFSVRVIRVRFGECVCDCLCKRYIQYR